MELGVYQGESLRLWRDYFRFGQIVGVDQHELQGQLGERIRIFRASQTDRLLLSKIAVETAPDGYDVIIDDASHLARQTAISFWHLFEAHLRRGGLYVIEDWGTGYWQSWPDGKRPRRSKWRTVLPRRIRRRMAIPSHQAGMVGFVKTLIDELGAGAIAQASVDGTRAPNASRFSQMIVRPGIIAIGLIVLGVVMAVWMIMDRSGLSAVSRDMIGLFGAEVMEGTRRIAPSLPLYAGAIALLVTALGIWWWAERDVTP